MKSDQAIKETVAKLPASIYSMYDKILHDLVAKNPDDLGDLRRILQWLVGCMVPLTLEELAEGISIRWEDCSLDHSGIATNLLDLAACCGSLVTVLSQDTSSSDCEDLRGPKITLTSLSHSSVEEYLKSRETSGSLLEYFKLDEKTIHHEIAKTFIQYVSFDDFDVPIERPVGGQIGICG